jgi:hypothetical protein
LETPEVQIPEVHPPHTKHGGLPRWFELAIAIAALVTSISSIGIAIHHGEIMNKLVRANSFPYLQGGFSDLSPDDTKVLSLDLFNRGVGPAHERSLRVKVNGEYVKSVNELLEKTLGTEQAAEANKVFTISRNVVPTRFIPAGQQQFVFRIPRTEENARFWDSLKAAQSKWNVDFCYCSVFDECWQVPAGWREPESVKECKRDEPREFEP